MYPDLEEVIQEVRIWSITHYVEVCLNYIINQPIFGACQEGMQKQGSSHHQFWWDQSFSLMDDPSVGVDDDNDKDMDHQFDWGAK